VLDRRTRHGEGSLDSFREPSQPQDPPSRGIHSLEALREPWYCAMSHRHGREVHRLRRERSEDFYRDPSTYYLSRHNKAGLVRTYNSSLVASILAFAR